MRLRTISQEELAKRGIEVTSSIVCRVMVVIAVMIVKIRLETQSKTTQRRGKEAAKEEERIREWSRRSRLRNYRRQLASANNTVNSYASI